MAESSVMCTLCGKVGSVETEAEPAATVTAMTWAIHFARVHPDAPGAVSQYIVMTAREPR